MEEVWRRQQEGEEREKEEARRRHRERVARLSEEKRRAEEEKWEKQVCSGVWLEYFYSQCHFHFSFQIKCFKIFN
jgi:hypothetical protein